MGHVSWGLSCTLVSGTVIPMQARATAETARSGWNGAARPLADAARVGHLPRVAAAPARDPPFGFAARNASGEPPEATGGPPVPPNARAFLQPRPCLLRKFTTVSGKPSVSSVVNALRHLGGGAWRGGCSPSALGIRAHFARREILQAGTSALYETRRPASSRLSSISGDGLRLSRPHAAPPFPATPRCR